MGGRESSTCLSWLSVIIEQLVDGMLKIMDDVVSPMDGKSVPSFCKPKLCYE